MTKQIYEVVYCTSCYSDYFEKVVGVTDDKRIALEYADRIAKQVNGQEKWWFNEDYIVIRTYTLNQFRIHLSKAERTIQEEQYDSEEEIYEEDDGIGTSKLCRVGGNNA